MIYALKDCIQILIETIVFFYPYHPPTKPTRHVSQKKSTRRVYHQAPVEKYGTQHAQSVTLAAQVPSRISKNCSVSTEDLMSAESCTGPSRRSFLRPAEENYYVIVYHNFYSEIRFYSNHIIAAKLFPDVTD